MHLLRTVFVVLLCYAISALATPILALAAQCLLQAAESSGPGALNGADVLQYLWFGTLLTFTYATAPALVAIGLMRWLHWRHWFVHGLAGVVTACIALSLFTGSTELISSFDVVPYVVTGAGAGLVYWLCQDRLHRIMTAAQPDV